jgi:hypothetical protein
MDKLGKEVRDKVTGFTGIITGKIIYLFGCSQYSVQQKVDSEGKKPSTEWLDEGRIEVIGEGITHESVQAEKPGAEGLHL